MRLLMETILSFRMARPYQGIRSYVGGTHFPVPSYSSFVLTNDESSPGFDIMGTHHPNDRCVWPYFSRWHGTGCEFSNFLRNTTQLDLTVLSFLDHSVSLACSRSDSW